MLVSLGTLAFSQAKFTEATAKALSQLLNYTETHPDASVCFHVINMHIQFHTEASYISESKARSREGGFVYFSSNPVVSGNLSPVNGAVLTISSIMDQFLRSSTE